jgi:hypothetical protein
VFDSNEKLYIVMELVSYEPFRSFSRQLIPSLQVTGGELFDRIILKEHYSETEAANCFFQVVWP